MAGMERTTRRQVLAGAGTAALVGTVGLAGCSGGGAEGAGGSEATGTGTGTADPQLSPPVRGDPDADVTLAVYEDFACPHCKDYNESGFPELAPYVEEGRIRYEHRDLPIPVLDPGSYEAANAARAVQDRHGDGAFWSYAEGLFARQSGLRSEAPELYAEVAEALGNDGASIREAAVDRAYGASVTADRQRAEDLGVGGTPGFVLNGEVVTSGFGDSTVATVTAALDEALSGAGGSGAGGSY